MRLWQFFLGLILLAAGTAAEAEEFHLKDGTKISGKIVTFENDAFKVETSFGLAIIYRDHILRIVFTSPEGTRMLELEDTHLKLVESPKPDPPPPPEVTAKPKVAEPTLTRVQLRPQPPPKPEKIIEHVSATQYVNETFGFRMYKPPTWRSFPALVRPDNPLLAALGTPDETTILLVGQEIFRSDVATYARLAEESLKNLYTDYRKLAERRIRIAGFPALERHFIGYVEGRFWSGFAIYFAHGDAHYTFLGLTAERETLDFQQSLFRKVLHTLEFGRHP